jgi:hypothetical protein
VNNQLLLKECVSILCLLSSISCLANAYSEVSQPFPTALAKKFSYYEPARLISYELMELIHPTSTFYECLLAMGNILHHTMMSEASGLK